VPVVVVVVVVLVVVVVVVSAVPVRTVPFSLNCVGSGLDPFHEPLKPGVAGAPVPRLAFQEALRTVTRLSDWEKFDDERDPRGRVLSAPSR
jgi:hypothetical protein